jgi:hypothetical protein
MVRHVIISDTHAPNIIQDIYVDVRDRIISEYNPDAIVINGDLLGVFSMQSSSVHKVMPATRQDKEYYLQLAAPNWYAKHGIPKLLTQEIVLSYVKERYIWVVNTLKKFSELQHTIWNMGNHESPHHFLVLQELPFLLDIEIGFHVSDAHLNKIFVSHEQSLAMLEITHKFTYIRNKPYVDGDVLFMPIPGESHDAVGKHFAAQKQEEKTKELIAQVTTHLNDITDIVIYNHTQGDYDKTTGTFQPASPAIKQFLAKLPKHLQHIIWVQSHNHWSYTQFLKQDRYHYVLNNAGMHGGIYNILDINKTITVYDVDVRTQNVTQLTVSEKPVDNSDPLKIIQRNYSNYMDIFLHRKMSLDSSLENTPKK